MDNFILILFLIFLVESDAGLIRVFNSITSPLFVALQYISRCILTNFFSCTLVVTVFRLMKSRVNVGEQKCGVGQEPAGAVTR